MELKNGGIVPICLNSDQIGQFSRDGRINLIEVLDMQNMQQILSEANEVISNRVSGKLSRFTSEDYIYSGRDLWRSSSKLKSLITVGSISQIASCLWWTEPNIKLLYDQTILLDQKNKDPYLRAFFNGSFSVAAYSCFSNILGSILLCLDGDVDFWYKLGDNVVPSKSGDCIGLSSDHCLSALKDSNCLVYLIVFGTSRSIYVENNSDPNSYALKSKGLCFGETLSINTHPFIKKSNLFC